MVKMPDASGRRTFGVVLMRKQGREQITAEEISEKIDSISHEVFCSIGKRVPRIYIRIIINFKFQSSAFVQMISG
jgi:alanine racemase